MGLGPSFIVSALALALPPAPALREPPIASVPLSPSGIDGFAFPEPEANISAWVSTLDSDPASAAAIARHGWGLWTALTAWTTQSHAGQRLRVFETWQTPQDLAGTAAFAPSPLSRGPRRLTLLHLPVPRRQNWSALATTEEDRVIGFIKYDPVAAAHIATQRLLQAGTLQTLLAGGSASIPPFPMAALVAKAIYRVIPASNLVQGRYYPLPVWEGPPATPRPYGPDAWPGVVWVDVLGRSPRPSVEVDETAMPDGSSRTGATTASLADFISFRLTASDASGLNADRPGTNAAAGDIALLVGMHVAGRETARWTWQTFWWAPSPDAPPAPSSADLAAERPPQLAGPARHYAMATAYTTALPSPPVLGGANDGRAVYAYNPYVEAALTPAQMPDSQPGLDPAGNPAANNTGVQSNCMSCHIRASFNPSGLATAPRPSGARYTDLGDAAFVGALQTDFLWSVARSSPSP